MMHLTKTKPSVIALVNCLSSEEEKRARRAGGNMAIGSPAQPSSRACSAVLSLVTPRQAAANLGQADMIGPSGRCLGLEVNMIGRKMRNSEALSVYRGLSCMPSVYFRVPR